MKLLVITLLPVVTALTAAVALEDVPVQLRTEELCRLAVSNDGWALRYVPEELRTEELCRVAVSNNGKALEYVPDRLRTEELCRVAVSSNRWALGYVPEELKTEELFRVAVNQNIDALRSYIPEQSRTIDLYVLALKKDVKALRYVPRDMRWNVLRELSDDAPLMIELIKDMKFRGHLIAPEWFRNVNASGNGSAEDQDAVSINDICVNYEEWSRILSMNGNNTLFKLLFIVLDCFRNGNTLGNTSGNTSGNGSSINDMRVHYEALSQILSLNRKNTLFTLPVSQLMGTESHNSQKTLHAEGSSGIADCIRSFLF